MVPSSSCSHIRFASFFAWEKTNRPYNRVRALCDTRLINLITHFCPTHNTHHSSQDSRSITTLMHVTTVPHSSQDSHIITTPALDCPTRLKIDTALPRDWILMFCIVVKYMGSFFFDKGSCFCRLAALCPRPDHRMVMPRLGLLLSTSFQFHPPSPILQMTTLEARTGSLHP
jgi:hypothetical protein